MRRFGASQARYAGTSDTRSGRRAARARVPGRLDPDRARDGLDRALALELQPVAARTDARESRTRSRRRSPGTASSGAPSFSTNSVYEPGRAAPGPAPITRAVNSTPPPGTASPMIAGGPLAPGGRASKRRSGPVVAEHLHVGVARPRRRAGCPARRARPRRRRWSPGRSATASRGRARDRRCASRSSRPRRCGWRCCPPASIASSQNWIASGVNGFGPGCGSCFRPAGPVAISIASTFA